MNLLSHQPSLKIALFALPLALAGLCLHASAFEPDGKLLKIKGFSPEVVKVADIQRSRQEWKEPAVPRQSPVEKFFHNVYYGEWTGGLDEFGSQVLRGD
jgi:hypothetical protein